MAVVAAAAWCGAMYRRRAAASSDSFHPAAVAIFYRPAVDTRRSARRDLLDVFLTEISIFKVFCHPFYLFMI